MIRPVGNPEIRFWPCVSSSRPGSARLYAAGLVWFFAIGFILGISGLRGDVVVDLGEHVLVPNQPEQRVPIRISGGDLIAGVNLVVQVEDGYPEVVGSMADGPNVTEIDLEGRSGATIFASNNSGQVNPGSGEQAAFRFITTQAGGVPAEGTLAWITIDTTGIYEGEFLLNLEGGVIGATELLSPAIEKIALKVNRGRLSIGEDVTSQGRSKLPTMNRDGWIFLEGEPGARYRIEATDSLSKPIRWSFLNVIVIDDSGHASLATQPESAPAQFIRIIPEP